MIFVNYLFVLLYYYLVQKPLFAITEVKTFLVCPNNNSDFGPLNHTNPLSICQVSVTEQHKVSARSKYFLLDAGLETG